MKEDVFCVNCKYFDDSLLGGYGDNIRYRKCKKPIQTKNIGSYPVLGDTAVESKERRFMSQRNVDLRCGHYVYIPENAKSLKRKLVEWFCGVRTQAIAAILEKIDSVAPILDEMSELSLPKWPQMIVRGLSVTQEQAKEVIRRTDKSFGPFEIGNLYSKFPARICEKIGHPVEEAGDIGVLYQYDRWLDWSQKWGYIQCDFVYNNWIEKYCVHGPAGWMNPDGKIQYGFNVGKWPSIDCLLQEWKVLAKEFPFINLFVILMSGEYCEDGTVPVVGIRVKDGSARLFDPADVDWSNFDIFGSPISEDQLDDNIYRLMDQGGRSKADEVPGWCAIPLEWFDEWGEKFFKKA
jgi:hypothetical protein